MPIGLIICGKKSREQIEPFVAGPERDISDFAQKITEDALEYGSSCASRSTQIDFNIGYA